MKKKLLSSLSRSKINRSNPSLIRIDKENNYLIKNSNERQYTPNSMKMAENKILYKQKLSSQKNYDKNDFFNDDKSEQRYPNYRTDQSELVKGSKFFNKIMSRDRRGHIIRILDSFDREHITVGNNIPLDLHLRKHFLKFKFVKSQDREFISNQVYSLIRNKGLIDFLTKPPMNWFSRFETYYSTYFERQKTNVNIPAHLRTSFPKEMFDLIKNTFGAENAVKYCSVMNERAPLTIRTNIIKITRNELYDSLKNKGFDIEKTEYSPYGITFRSHPQTNFFSLDEYKNGQFEVQDEASQLVSLRVQAKPGDLVLDYCGGSGGKTLAIAPFTMGKGQIFIHDIRKNILVEAKKRLRRAGVQNYQLMHSKDELFEKYRSKFDWILLDVPCSGSGTLRRNPDIKWKFSLQKLEEYIVVQEKIFEESLQLLKPYGKIVYVTCSLFQEENMNQIVKFTKKFGVKIDNNSVFQTVPTSKKMDGFFSATLLL